jgi:SAM-dependent methyltransferase
MDLTRKYGEQTEFDRTLEMASRFERPDSVDNWRHTRMLDMAMPVYRMYPESRWMTVGDGRFGSDAAYLLHHGLSTIATSLTDERLKQAQALGFIKEYQAENAEKLSYDAGAVDFILCKESYHHFPRPPVALYEMLRVARRGVVLIEPADNAGLLNWFRTLAKKILRGDTQHQFEPSGNYLYRTNMKELSKLLLAMGGTVFAYKGFNDFYIPKFSNCRADDLNIGSFVTRLGVFVQNLLAKSHLMGYGLACIVLFSTSPPEDLLAALSKDGFTVQRLPKNPYT